MKRYFITAIVILVAVSFYSTWRTNCDDGCEFEIAAFGLPVFLRTPYSPVSDHRIEFFFVPLLINIVWIAAASSMLWMVADTGARWQRRRGTPKRFP